VEIGLFEYRPTMEIYTYEQNIFLRPRDGKD
jgi:hypothetical protein